MDLADADAAAIQTAVAAGELSSVEVTEHCLARIAEDDPRVRAVLALDPTALDQARAADADRAAGRGGPLLGIPVLIKDNIATTGLPTTAGSRALAESMPPDAPLVTRLREAGAIVLGKANLSEWANFRSRHSTSGWSGLGGQTGNPHVLDRNPSGSSSGSAAAAAAGFAPLTIGTETDGSIVSPAGYCGVVGFKPTLGSVPGAGIVPISAAQDVAGPITRSVRDAAALFEALSGRAARLDEASIRGARFGVWRPTPTDAATTAVLDAAIDALTSAGATLVDVELDPAAVQETEWPALLAEFKYELTAYLAAAPGAHARDLPELIAFNAADPVELSRFGQDNLEDALAAASVDDPAYREQRRATTTGARALIDDTLAQHRLDAIMTLTNGPADVIRYGVVEDEGGFSTSTPAAAAGYPTITVPGGFVGPLPIGISLIAGAGQDARLLDLAFGFEHLTLARRAPAYQASMA